MSRAHIPGFDAEASLRSAARHYPTNFGEQGIAANVQPALRGICDVVAELVWGAYNEGAYNRAEFWEHVMDRAGCFK